LQYKPIFKFNGTSPRLSRGDDWLIVTKRLQVCELSRSPHVRKNNSCLKLSFLLELAEKTLQTRHSTYNGLYSSEWVNSECHKEFETASLSFIINAYGAPLLFII